MGCGASLLLDCSSTARLPVHRFGRRCPSAPFVGGEWLWPGLTLAGLLVRAGEAAMTKRRHKGEGGISEYRTRSGPRFLIKYLVGLEDGTTRVVLKRGFLTKKDAAAALRSEIGKAELGQWVPPSNQRLDAYLEEWIQGQRLSASTVASYRKNIRLHIDPHLGSRQVARLTGPMVDIWMRKLESSGRADGTGGLSARTVRYVFTILRSALSDAVKHGRLSVNPTDRSTPPSPSERFSGGLGGEVAGVDEPAGGVLGGDRGQGHSDGR